MNALSKAILPQEHTRDWRKFWTSEAPIHAGPGLRLEHGDSWATVRDWETGKVLESFVIATTRSEIIGRLAQLRLDRATASSNHP